jgi:hypothetical protein
MVDIADDEQVNMAKTMLLENANMGDLGVLQIKPTTQIKGKHSTTTKLA